MQCLVQAYTIDKEIEFAFFLRDEEEEDEEQFGQIEASYFGALSALSAVVVGMSR